MKRLKFIAAATLLALSLSACGSGQDAKAPASSETPISSPESTKIVQTEPHAETESVASNTELTLSDLENYMLDNGVISGKKTQMSAEMVGAIEGFKYGDFNTEVYEYDVNSEQYITLSSGKEIELEGMPGFTVGAVSINGKFVLMGEPSQEIIDCFDSFN